MKKTYLSPEIKIRRPRLRTHLISNLSQGIGEYDIKNDTETDDNVFDSKNRYDEFNDYDNNW